MKTGIFSGSFNPIHQGHLIISDFLVNFTDLEELWLIVSPQNPLKSGKELAPDTDRLQMCQLAFEGHPSIRISDVEFQMSKPSYTINTLNHLRSLHPEREFVLVIGGDNLYNFHKWKSYEEILDNFRIYVYKRPGHRLGSLKDHPNVKVLEAPQLLISATFIRTCINDGKSVRYLLPESVQTYIRKNKLYQSWNIP